MKYGPINKVTKTGLEVVIKSLTKNDVEQKIAIALNEATTSDFMIREADEVDQNKEALAELFEKTLQNPYVSFVGVFNKDELVGSFGVFQVNKCRRLAHRCEIGLGVKDNYRGQGIGKIMVESALEVAKLSGYSQVELTVASQNIPGVKLYTSCGFKKVGTIPNASHPSSGKILDWDIMIKEI